MGPVRPALSVGFLRELVLRRRIRVQGGEPGPVTLQDLLALHGDASLVVVLLVLSILIVLPLAGVGTVLSFAIFAIAWRWASGEEIRTRVPFESTHSNIALSPAWSERTLHFPTLLYTRADRWLHPRRSQVCHARWVPWWAAWIALMGPIIFLPLPFGNILPSLSWMLLCLAWMFRDGVASIASLFVGGAAMTYTTAFSHLAWTMGSQTWEKIAHWLPG